MAIIQIYRHFTFIDLNVRPGLVINKNVCRIADMIIIIFFIPIEKLQFTFAQMETLLSVPSA